MFARVTYMEGAPARADQAVVDIRDRALPVTRDAAGFEGLLLLVDADAGRAMAVTFWSTRRDMDGSEDLANSLRHLPDARWAVQAVERYEVALRT